MGFSGAPQITQTEQLSFLHYWQGAAKSAASQLGIPSSWILAQWAMETGWGTQRTMGVNNPGNVGPNGSGGWVNYPSQQAFVAAYVASMVHDFPGFTHYSVLARTNTSYRGYIRPVLTPQDYLNGPNKYDPGTTRYGSKVAAVLPTVQRLLGEPVSNGSGTQPISNKLNPYAKAPSFLHVGSWLSSVEQWAAKEAITILLIVALLIVIVVMLLKGLGVIGREA